MSFPRLSPHQLQQQEDTAHNPKQADTRRVLLRARVEGPVDSIISGPKIRRANIWYVFTFNT